MEPTVIKSTNYSTWLNIWLLSLGAFVTLIHTYVWPVSQFWQLVLFVLSILCAGIPHGALDHLVAQKNSELKQEAFSSFRFFSMYFFRMALFGAGWYFFPIPALALFVLFSAYHFGETDLAIFSHNGMLLTCYRLCYGLLLLFFLLLTHLEEVKPILMELRNEYLVNLMLQAPVYRTSILWGMSALTLALALVYHLKNNSLQLWRHALQLGCILWILGNLPLLLGFTFYFGCWHSLHSLENIRIHLSADLASPLGWRWIVAKSMPFTLVAISFIIAILLLASYLKTMPLILLGFFIGIAILTAPHLEVMSHMYKWLYKKKR